MLPYKSGAFFICMFACCSHIIQNKRSYSEANSVVKELQRAIDHQQHIRIIYLGQDGQTTMRTLRPLEVMGGRLKAYCLTRKAPRVFVINNILAVAPVVSSRAV
ncbi:WYL domain-containing protein [Brevibacillus centrosporus]|uniref:WYL domain-containing protein n=1 Tax=Brevibacillus centrosporus TaxID=54910 RepID=UPI003B023382